MDGRSNGKLNPVVRLRQEDEASRLSGGDHGLSGEFDLISPHD